MKKHAKSILLPILIVTIGVLLAYKIGRMMASGSYPYAETYELNYSEELVKKAISKFKQENPQYLVPKISIDGSGTNDLKDRQTENPSYWFVIYFYYADKNEIIYTWTRPCGNNKTTFAFVQIKKGLDLGHWKRINDDFDFFENRKIKKEFEERILIKIKSNLNSNK